MEIVKNDNIPKIIHYCWFGPNKMKSLQLKCLKSWEEKLNGYEFRKWDETNVNMTHPFIQFAYENKKWAFVADFIRLQKLLEFGGIYLDTDILVLKPFDDLLVEKCFFGAEDENFINASIIGSTKNHPFLKLCLEQYNKIDLSGDLIWSGITIPRIITRNFRANYNFSSRFNRIIKINNLTVFPPSFFYPLPNLIEDGENKYKKYLTENSYTVHLWDASWIEYNEFQYFRKGNYWKGFKKVMCNILREGNFNLKYIRKNLSAIKESFI